MANRVEPDVTDTFRRDEPVDYRVVFDRMLDGFALHEIICDDDGKPIDYRFLAVNPAFERLTGLRADDVVGRRVREVLPDTEDFWIETYGSVALTGKPHQFEQYTRSLDRHFEVSAFSPERGRFACLFVDITSRKEAEDERDRLFDVSLDLFAIADFDGYLRQVNPIWETLLGWSREELLGSPWIEFVHPDDRARTQELTELLVNGGRRLGFENRLLCKGGGDRYFSWSGLSLPERRRIYAVARDTTDRKAEEQRQRELEARLNQSQKMEAIGQLASGVAHDFNNLLTVIMGHVELLQASLPPQHHGDLSVILDAANQGADLTRALLTFGKQLPIRGHVFDLANTVREAGHLLRRMIPANIEFEFDVPPGGECHIEADAGQLQQLLINLAINARDAMPQGGTLHIALAKLDGSVRQLPQACADWGEAVELLVADNGAGMPPDVRDRAFEPFFTTKVRGRGTGLGLSTVQGIVEGIGGDISLDSEPGRGTTVRILLRHASSDARQPTLAPERHGKPALIGRGERLLLAEDNELVAGSLVGTMRAYGFEIEHVADGLSLVAAVTEGDGRFDLLLVDYDLPGCNGIEGLRRIRAAGRFMPAVVITGRPEIELEEQLDDSTLLILKPFETRSLAEMVANVIRSQASPA